MIGGGDGSPAKQSGEVTALVVDGGVIPVMNDGDGVVDGVQKMTATSNLWPSTAGASRGDSGVRLEATAASVVVGGLEKLREKAGQAINQRSRERGEGGGARGEKERLHCVEIDDVWRQNLRAPASDLSSLMASF
jgi:hypothetical protein